MAPVNEPKLATKPKSIKEAKRVAGAVSKEASPDVDKHQADSGPSKSAICQVSAAVSNTALPAIPQERLPTNHKCPVSQTKTSEKKDFVRPEANEVTGVQLEGSWHPGGRPMTGIDLTTIYGNGFLQYTALLIATIGTFALLCHNLLLNVVAPSVVHWCKQPPEYFNMTAEEWRNISTPQGVNGPWDQCFHYEPPLSVASSNRTQVPCRDWDYEPGSGRSITSEWNLVCERRWLLTLASVVYMSSAMASVPIVGKLSDGVGRRPIICVSVAALVVFGMAVCFARTLYTFLVLRVVVAASVGAVRLTSFVLLYELSTPKYQCLYCVLAIGGGLITAPLYLGLVGFFETNWILAQVVTMLPTSLLASAFYVTAESPRWLISKTRYEDAERSILWAAKMNRKGVKQTMMQWRPMREALRQVDVEVSTHVKSGLSGILSSPIMLRRSAILCYCWLVSVLAYYARFRVHKTEYLWLLAVTIALKIPSFFLMYRFLTTLGRRSTVCGAFAGFSLNFGCAVLLTEFNLFPWLVEMMHWVCNVFVDMTITLLFTFTVELFPTEVRSIGLCAGYFFGRIGSILEPLMFELSHTESLLAISILGVFAALLVLFLPETMSCIIVDTIKDMDAAKLQEKLDRLDELLKSSAKAVVNQVKNQRKTQGKAHTSGRRLKNYINRRFTLDTGYKIREGKLVRNENLGRPI
ncbi:solute carrier family 22 member 13-like [Ixodes scapularis]